MKALKKSSTKNKKISTKKVSKYQSGGLVGNQTMLDRNKNNKLDKGDFKILRQIKK